jgi:PIN domain nuclease of toxin-antitoxin system
VSVAGLWELADKASKGKLPEFAAITDGGPSGLEDALQESSMRLLPVMPGHVVRLRHMQLHHRDPFDRMMIAQAVAEDLTLISHDALFGRYANLKLLLA